MAVGYGPGAAGTRLTTCSCSPRVSRRLALVAAHCSARIGGACQPKQTQRESNGRQRHDRSECAAARLAADAPAHVVGESQRRISTGTVMDESTVRVTPPSTISRARLWP